MDPLSAPLLQNSTAAHMACRRSRRVMEERQRQQILGCRLQYRQIIMVYLQSLGGLDVVSSHFN